jgi:hypothetical protein
LKEDGFGMVVNVLKDILAIEWRYPTDINRLIVRDEKEDVILHQILLCLKALLTTDVFSPNLKLI